MPKTVALLLAAQAVCRQAVAEHPLHPLHPRRRVRQAPRVTEALATFSWSLFNNIKMRLGKL